MIEADPDNNLLTRTLGNKFRKFFTRVVSEQQMRYIHPVQSTAITVIDACYQGWRKKKQTPEVPLAAEKRFRYLNSGNARSIAHANPSSQACI